MSKIPAQIVGVTSENVKKNIDRIEQTLRSIAKFRRPTIRIVFNLELNPQTEYLGALRRLHGTSDETRIAYVVGEIADSFFLWRFNDQHKGDPSHLDLMSRLDLYLETLGDFVDVWEIGNEVNGEWSGWKEIDDCDGKTTHDWTADGMGKMRATVARQTYEIFQRVKSHPKTKLSDTLLTLYFYTSKNKDCWPDTLKAPDCSSFDVNGEDYEMLKWLNDHDLKPPRFAPEYVLLSVYEDDCNNIVPSIKDWLDIFRQVQGAFRHAKIGFGETGSHCYDKSKPCSNQQVENITKHYGELHATLTLSLSDYVGGYFHWFFDSDMLKPNSMPLQALIDAIRLWR